MSKPQKTESEAEGRRRRADQRTAFDIKIGIATKHRLFVGLTDNISTGGLFVATDEELQKGDKIEVRFHIPGSDHTFAKKAEVAWIRPYDELGNDRNSQAGAGLRLLDLTDDEKRMLNSFIAEHEPLFFVQ